MIAYLILCTLLITATAGQRSAHPQRLSMRILHALTVALLPLLGTSGPIGAAASFVTR